MLLLNYGGVIMLKNEVITKIERKRANLTLPLDLLNMIDNFARLNMLSRGQVISIGMRKYLQSEELLKTLTSKSPNN